MSDPRGTLVRVLHTDSLFSESELRRCVSLLLKEHGVPNRVIKDIIHVSTPTMQGWWRDWRADQTVASIIDRRRGYTVSKREVDTVRQHLVDPAHRGRLSVKFLSQRCAMKTSAIEIILKILCHPLPQLLESDKCQQRASCPVRRLADSGQRRTSSAVLPERQQVFDDALDFLQQLEKGGVHSSRQGLFDNALAFLEKREWPESAPDKAQKASASSAQNVDDVLSFIEDRERERDSGEESSES